VMTGIPGSPPDMRNLPDGCAFHPRCRYALPRCAQEVPVLTSPALTSPALTSPALASPALTSPALTSPALAAGSRRLVACWLHEERALPDELAAPELEGQPRLTGNTPMPAAPEPSGGPR
jgi:peptide/nickel transport system ATP-binding protein